MAGQNKIGQNVNERPSKLAWLKHFCYHRRYPGLRRAHFHAPRRLVKYEIPTRDWSATVATARTTDTEPTILLRFNDSKYIFNAGDNTTRAFIQYSPTSTRMRAVFLTRVAAATVGGLGGAIASISRTVHSLTVVGPPGIRHFIASLRGFVRGLLKFSLIQYQPQVNHGELQAIYKDENVTVSAFPITPYVNTDESSEKQVEIAGGGVSRFSRAKTSVGLTAEEVRQAAVYHMFKDNSANTPPEFLEDEEIVDDRERWIPNWLHEKQLPSFSFPETYPRSSTLAYVVVGPRPETLFRKSSKEEDIPPHPVVLILDVPSQDYLPSILRSFDNECAPFLYPYSTAEYKVKAVYHMLGLSVVFDSRYYKFLKQFAPHTKHFISCPEMSPDFFTFPHNAWRLYQLARLDPEMFPPLRRRLTKPRYKTCLALLSTEIMRPGLQIRLDQDAFFHGAVVYNFGSRTQTQSSILQQMLIPEDVLPIFAAARRNVAHHPDAQRIVKRISARVVCLGTGKSMPNQFRNVISTLLMTPDGHIMLDCGEGTAQQLERLYGMAYPQILRDTKCIFISHAHADHHLGLINLLRRRKLNTRHPPEQPLYIVATRLVHLFLKEYQQLEDIGLCDDPAQNGVIQIVSDALNYRRDEYPKRGQWRMLGTEPWLDLELSRQRNMDMCKNLNLISFETIDVYHRTRAFGALIRHKSNWSVTYSGDTMPTINLVKLGYGTDLLIHEASLKHGAEASASERGHSTIGQAIRVGCEMNAKRVLLTHLLGTAVTLPSVQLAKEFENTDTWIGPVVGVANDFMEIDLDKFWKANLYTAAIASCHRSAFALEKKSVAQLLWDHVPEESLVCSPNIEYFNYWPWKKTTEKDNVGFATSRQQNPSRRRMGVKLNLSMDSCRDKSKIW